MYGLFIRSMLNYQKFKYKIYSLVSLFNLKKYKNNIMYKSRIKPDEF